ncbi:HEAT repeat domain-containing protein [Paludisphaera rhizosphaerae]|uniref:HEAT repeat domain-containing protein n=1 Tax=Paludisphaera rhizosphaerae TaxID=2711216 RepID=UPI0013EC6E5B|nr:HEAT repeat domain-containing protein [Paludisphaera rhizosphaerae]
MVWDERLHRGRGAWAFMLSAACLLGASAAVAVRGQEAAAPHWIWRSGLADPHGIPAERCYFRKNFVVKEPSRLSLFAAADNAFELFLDGRKVAGGEDWRNPEKVDVQIGAGRHVLAAWASNEAPGRAGFLVSGGALPLGQGAPVHTNQTWRAVPDVPPNDSWKGLDFDDSRWPAPVDLGEFGVEPWGRLALGLGDAADRFRTPEGFKVETAASPKVTGSVIAFTFDPDGAPCVSVERGPIARLVDEDHDGVFEKAVVIETAVTNCQGLHFAGDALYAVGQGPNEPGLHRLTDADKDGVFEKAELIRGVNGGMGEHGPHAVMIGPDGRLYYNSGNHSHLKPPIDPASPLNIAYEGELLPHMNDSRGHAAGILAPGGEIYRSDDMGKSWKRVVGGFRNQYDFAFNSQGELFTFDSDMEWDVGVPWYRPVRVNHCPIGGELGWRNGSADWPAYYFDSLPATIDLGRGSPTGVTFYQGSQFPAEYRDQFFICDWSQGRILAIALTKDGASYSGKAQEMVSGQPLNCTDIETGPDGCVYFTTGGRGTQGGLFRLKSTRAASPKSTPSDFLAAALEIDSPLSSYSSKQVAKLKAAHEGEWKTRLEAAARDASGRTSSAHRARALDLMEQHGPAPSESLLIALSTDADATVRGRAVSLLGYHATDASRQALTKALGDKDPFVQRHACESLMQQPGETIPAAALMPLLGGSDRFLRSAARTAIEHADPAKYRDALLAVDGTRSQLEAMLALVRGTKFDQAAQSDLFARQLSLLQQNLDSDLRLDLLRLIQLTYLLGPSKAEVSASREFRPRLLAMFSEKVDTPVNREVAKLLAFLDEPKAVPAILAHQEAVADTVSQIHDTYCLRTIKSGWDSASKKQFWKWFDRACTWDGGYSYLGFLDMMLRDWLPVVTPEERAELLAQGEAHPFPTRVLVREMDVEKDAAGVATLTGLYERLVQAKAKGPQADDLKGTILERLGRSSSESARVAIRSLMAADPGSRERLIRAMAERPSKEDLPTLAAALDSRDENTLRLLLRALQRIDGTPDGAEAPASLIRLARRAEPGLRGPIRQIANKWLGKPGTPDAGDYEKELAFWDRAYKAKHPNGPATTETMAAAAKSRDLADLVRNVLQADVMKNASPKRGTLVMERIRCLDCHKFGEKGQGLGPDLSTVNSRFQPADILDSIVTPSKVISDQYKPITVALSDGRILSGMPVVADGPTMVLLVPDGSKISIPKNEIEEQKPSTISVMPEGLLDPLSYQDIADLIALFESVPRVASPAQPTTKP